MSTKFDADFGEFLYNSLPPIYRQEDANNSYTLEAFLDTLNSGGFQTVIDSLNGLDDLIDIDSVPAKYLKHLCSLFGFDYSTLDDETYNPVLPEWFIRRLLHNIIPLLRKKGTKSCVNYIARELSGFTTSIIENKDFSDDQVTLTGWQRNFVNRKNFILKLSAPDETSQLQEKEDAVAFALTSFLAVWCQCYIITSYWFQESRDIQGTESTEKNTVKDYTTETRALVSKGVDTTDKSTLTDKYSSESYTIPNKTMTGGENLCVMNNNNYRLNTGFRLNHVTHYDTVKIDGQDNQYLY